MFSMYSSLKRNIKAKAYRLTVFEIVVFGALLAIYILSAYIERYLFPRAFRITITYAIFIVFGLALGPWKGAFLGILCDTLNQIIYGISTWTIEYAIIPPIIAFLSGLLMQITHLNPKRFWAYGFAILSIITIVIIYFIVKNVNTISWNEYSRKLKKISLLPTRIVATIVGVGLSIIWIFSLVLVSIYLRKRKFQIKWHSQLIFGILITTFLILIFTRWLWGPFAYINYMNRFRNMNWKYQDYFVIFMIPIVFKSLIEIPVYTIIIYAIMPIINLLKQKISFYKNKIFTY